MASPNRNPKGSPTVTVLAAKDLLDVVGVATPESLPPLLPGVGWVVVLISRLTVLPGVGVAYDSTLASHPTSIPPSERSGLLEQSQ
jgi:hypothetical protein